jgi:hypothetical protein
MKTSLEEKLIFLFAALTIICLLLLVVPVYADDDCRGNSCNGGGDVNVDTQVDVANEILGGDVSMSDDTLSLGFGRSSFDVDLNQCMGSTAWDTVLGGKQKLVLNKWCAAESYDARGLHHMAALIRCDIPEISKHFELSTECVAANTVARPTPPLHPVEEIRNEEEERFRDEQRMMVAELQMQLEEVQRLQQRAPRPTTTTKVVKEPLLTDAQRTALEELKK